MENNQDESILQMHLDYDGGNILHQTVRWSRFLSIVGIIGLAFCLLGCALASTVLLTAFSQLAPGLDTLGSLGSAIIIAALLVIFAVFGILVYMLYRFSVLIRKGIDQQDAGAFAQGMRCLKIYFLVSGIFAILSLLSNLFSLTKLFHS